MKKEITKYLSQNGAKGGKSKSPAKLKAIRENLKKANAARAKTLRREL